jgi:hypothetical protein
MSTKTSMNAGQGGLKSNLLQFVLFGSVERSIRTKQGSILALFFHNGNDYLMDTRSVARLAASNVPQPVAMS